MKSVSKIALAAATAFGTSALLSPALAAMQMKNPIVERAEANNPSAEARPIGPAPKKKKEEAQAQAHAQLKVSEAFRKAAAEADAAAKAGDVATTEAKVAAAEAVAANADEKFYAARLRYDLETKKQNNAGRGAALEVLIGSGRIAGTDLANLHFLRGYMLNQEKKYAEALVQLNKARELGSTQTDLPLQRAVAQFNTKDATGGAASMGEAIAAEERAGKKAPEAWYKITVSELYKVGNKAGAAEWLGRQIAAYPTADAWRSSLLVFMEQANAKGTTLDADQRLDLLRLMRASKSMAGESDYHDYADVAQRRGLPWEAKAVIDEGRAAGKIAKPSTRLDPIYSQAVARAKAEVSLAQEEKRAASAANGSVAMSTADAHLASNNLPKAVELYRLALQKGSVDTNLVNTRLGIALALSGQKAEAKTVFATVSGSPRGEIAKFWIRWIDQAA